MLYLSRYKFNRYWLCKMVTQNTIYLFHKTYMSCYASVLNPLRHCRMQWLKPNDKDKIFRPACLEQKNWYIIIVCHLKIPILLRDNTSFKDKIVSPFLSFLLILCRNMCLFENQFETAKTLLRIFYIIFRFTKSEGKGNMI